MPEGTIDKLSIEIAGSSSSAAQSINDLANSLSRLQSNVGDGAAKLEKLAVSMKSIQSASTGVRLGSLATAIEKIASSVNKLPTDTASRLGGLKALSALGTVKVSSTIGNTINSVATAVSALPEGAVGRLAGLTSALRPLSDLNGIRIGDLAKLPAVLKEFSKLNIGAFSTQLVQLNTALKPLAGSVQKLSTAYGSMPKSMRSAGVAAKSVTSANERLTQATNNLTNASHRNAKSLGSWVSSIISFKAKLTAVYYLAKRTIGAIVHEVNSYIENMNLFDASMGQFAQSARDYGNKVQTLMGIDFGEWARNQGVFMTLATGMGVTADKASVMSEQLTQLGYDIASFYNLNVSDAMLKLQSGLAGELEPLRRIGWDLSNARMNVELTKMGIDANAQSMTQAEKVALRYKMIMEQVTITHGDMARTLASPANQIRVLKAQITLAARAIGNLFIPALNAILPVAIGVVKAIRLIAQAIASVFGIDATFEVDYSTLDTSGIASGVDDTADAFEDAGSAAEDATKKVKEYQNTVMGFDELNKLNATPEYDDADGGGGGGGVGDLGGAGGADFGLPTYDFLEGLNNQITRLSDAIAQKLFKAVKTLVPVVAGVGAAFALWKIAPALGSGLTKLTGLLRGAAKEAGRLAGHLNTAGKTRLFNITKGLGQGFARMAAAAGSVAAVLTDPALLLPWAAAIGLVVGHFVNLAVNSENFRRGVKAIKDLFDGWGEVVEAVKTKIVEMADKFKQWWDNIEVEFPALAPLKQFLDQIAEAAKPVIDVLTGIGNKVQEVFDLQWTDALMVAGIALAAFTANPAIAAFLAVMEAVSLAIRAIGWAVSPVIEEVDPLADVMEETAESFGTSLDSMQDNMQAIAEFDWADKIISEEDVARIERNVKDIHDTIVNNLDAKKNEELASIEALAGVLTPEEVEQAKQKVEEYYEGLKGIIDDGQNEILSIVSTAQAEGRALTEEESDRIREINDEQYKYLLETSGASADELNKIREAMDNNDKASALEAAKVVAEAAKKAKDDQIAAAEETFNTTNQWASRMRENGDISEEEYQRIITAAEEARDRSVSAAEEAYADVKRETEEGLGDIANTFDFETASIMSNWTEFCSGITSWWDWVRDSLNVPAIGQIQIHGETVEFTGQDTGYYGGGFATGGFPTSGQLFMAREDGNPELVGRMGRRTAVANTGQIVEGIEAGVTNAMLQVLPAFSADNNSGDATMILNVDGETLARAVARGGASAMRRGQLTTEMAFA